MYLKGIKYVEQQPSSVFIFPEADVKARVKILVPETGIKSYKEVIDIIEKEYLAKGIHLKSDDTLRCIKEVDAEWHPKYSEELITK